MFSLLVTIVAIALVAALALATIYFGGTIAQLAAASANASTLANQGAQIYAASLLYEQNTGAWPTAPAVLVPEYLTTVPVPPSSSYALNSDALVSEALADQGTPPSAEDWTWVAPAPVVSRNVWLRSKINEPACHAVNLKFGNHFDILAGVDSSQAIQCFGTAAPYTFVYLAPAGADGKTVCHDIKGPNLDNTVSGYNFDHPSATIDCAAGPSAPSGGGGNPPSSNGPAIAFHPQNSSFTGWDLGTVSTSATFPDTQLGDVGYLNFLMVNIGDAQLTFTDAHLGLAAPFQLNWTDCGTSLAPGASCEVDLVFSPTTLGAAHSTYALPSNAIGYTPLPLSAVGIAQRPAMAVYDSDWNGPISSFAFPTTATNESSSTTFYLMNLGMLPLTFDANSFGTSTPFSIAPGEDCSSATLDYGSFCTVSVTFTPTQVPAATGTLAIASNDSTYVPVSLSGAGVLPKATLQFLNGQMSPISSLSFPTTDVGSSSAYAQVNLKNTGQLDLVLGTVNLSDDSLFYFWYENCSGQTVAPGDHCAVAVVFAPWEEANGAITLNVDSNDPDATPLPIMGSTPNAPTGEPLTYTFSLKNAQGAAITSLTLPATEVGVTSTPTSVTLANTGTGELAFSGDGIVVSWDHSYAFGSSNTCGSSVAVGTSCVISLWFTPDALGTFSEALRIDSNATNYSTPMPITGSTPRTSISLRNAQGMPISSVTFPAMSVNTQSDPIAITLVNTGTAQLTALDNPFINVNPTFYGPYQESDDCSWFVAPGASCTIYVTFRPTDSDTTYSEVLGINSNASNYPAQCSTPGPDGPVWSTCASSFAPLTLTGASLALPEVTGVPTDVQFDVPFVITGLHMNTSTTFFVKRVSDMATFDDGIASPTTSGAATVVIHWSQLVNDAIPGGTCISYGAQDAVCTPITIASEAPPDVVEGLTFTGGWMQVPGWTQPSVYNSPLAGTEGVPIVVGFPESTPPYGGMLMDVGVYASPNFDAQLQASAQDGTLHVETSVGTFTFNPADCGIGALWQCTGRGPGTWLLRLTADQGYNGAYRLRRILFSNCPSGVTPPYEAYHFDPTLDANIPYWGEWFTYALGGGGRGPSNPDYMCTNLENTSVAISPTTVTSVDFSVYFGQSGTPAAAFTLAEGTPTTQSTPASVFVSPGDGRRFSNIGSVLYTPFSISPAAGLAVHLGVNAYASPFQMDQATITQVGADTTLLIQ